MNQDLGSAGIRTPADACAALAVLMAGADGMGSMEEGRFIMERARAFPVFADLDASAFSDLLAHMTDAVWPSLAVPAGEFDEEALTGLIGRIREMLPEELRRDALRMATDLAWVDGYSNAEHALLGKLRNELQPGRG